MWNGFRKWKKKDIGIVENGLFRPKINIIQYLKEIKWVIIQNIWEY